MYVHELNILSILIFLVKACLAITILGIHNTMTRDIVSIQDRSAMLTKIQSLFGNFWIPFKQIIFQLYPRCTTKLFSSKAKMCEIFSKEDIHNYSRCIQNLPLFYL